MLVLLVLRIRGGPFQQLDKGFQAKNYPILRYEFVDPVRKEEEPGSPRYLDIQLSIFRIGIGARHHALRLQFDGSTSLNYQNRGWASR